MQLHGFDISHFLQHHWQKKPLLIRNPWTDWQNPLDADELAGLACDEGVEARLVIGGDQLRTMENGPFPEARFGELGSGPWTLLVQAVDHHVPDVSDLIEPFRFVPDWRIDDVMVSYATDGGGVGSHYDQYDVFLIQGAGKRRWRVGPQCTSQTPLLPHKDLRLIADFEATNEWILEPGDILYVPPCYAHDGVAVGDDCMTYSIGFRAPSRAELVTGWAEHQAENLLDEDRYADPDLEAQAGPGEITATAIDRLHGIVMEALSDRDAFARWFGQFNSLPKYEVDWRPDSPIDRSELQAMLLDGTALTRNPAVRFAFVRRNARETILFVDGRTYDCTDETALLAERICGSRMIELAPETAENGQSLTLIAELIDQGSIGFADDD